MTVIRTRTGPVRNLYFADAEYIVANLIKFLLGGTLAALSLRYCPQARLGSDRQKLTT